jgi:hypothetical protein
MKMTVFFDVAPCSLVEVHLRFKDAYCLHHQGDEYSSWQISTRLQTEDSHLRCLVVRYLEISCSYCQNMCCEWFGA